MTEPEELPRCPTCGKYDWEQPPCICLEQKAINTAFEAEKHRNLRRLREDMHHE